MDEVILGSIILHGCNFEINGFAFCDGRLMNIADNEALFSILGTTYGGDGQETFALPDFRGRVPIHFGQGPGLSNYVLGEMAGREQATLTVNNLPAHNHMLNAFSEPGDSASPEGTVMADTDATDPEYHDVYTGTLVQMGAQAISSVGGGQPIEVRQPYLVVNYQIALYGVYPSQN